MKKEQEQITNIIQLKQKYQKRDLKNIFLSCFGNKQSICKKLNCTLRVLTKYLYKNDFAKEWLEQGREQIIELSEKVIVDALQHEDLNVRMDAAKYVLQRLGKNKGWGTNDINLTKVEINNYDKEKQIKAIFNIQDEVPNQEVIDVEDAKLIEDDSEDDSEDDDDE